MQYNGSVPVLIVTNGFVIITSILSTLQGFVCKEEMKLTS